MSTNICDKAKFVCGNISDTCTGLLIPERFRYSGKSFCKLQTKCCVFQVEVKK